MPKLLILGCGYLGERVASVWCSRGGAVDALTRSPERAERFIQSGWQPVVGDVLDQRLALPPADIVLWSVGHDRNSAPSLRDVFVGGLDNMLDRVGSDARFVYISSTSVYGQTAGEWVDESAATEPVSGSGRIVLEAERHLRRRKPDAVVLRFAGLYGPDRLLRRAEQLRHGESVAGDPETWLNLIHGADGARAVLAAIDRAAAGSTYNISDGAPVRRRDYFGHLAQLLDAPEPAFSEDDNPFASNRRIDARRAQNDIHFFPRFPSYQEGLADAVVQSCAPSLA